MGTPEQEATKATETWDCVHPCALLVHLYQVGKMQGEGEDPEIERTLHAWGWMDEDGKPDIERALREINRFLGPKVVEHLRQELEDAKSENET